MERFRRPPGWIRDRMAEGQPLAARRLGDSILSAISIAQIHGLTSPSMTELREMAADPVKAEAARQNLGSTLLVEMGAAGLIGFAFANWTPGVVAAGTSLLLYYLGIKALGDPIRTESP